MHWWTTSTVRKEIRVAVLRANNRYGRVGVMEFRDAALRMGNPLVLEVRFEDGETSFTHADRTDQKFQSRCRGSLGKCPGDGPDPKPDAGTGNGLTRIRIRPGSKSVVSEDRREHANGIVTTCQYNPKG